MDPWSTWLEPHGESPPLDEALHRVARDEGCAEPFAAIAAQLDALAEGLDGAGLGPLLRRLFEEQGFRGDEADYDHPQNSRIDRVLARRRGLPILLCTVAMEVGRRAGVELVGIGFPGHFLVRPAHAPGLFVDPFRGGQVLTPDDLREALGPGADLAAAIAPTAPLDLLVRVSTNLMGSWLRREDPARALVNAERRVALRPTVPELVRDRGLVRAHVGQAEAAALDLASYLDARPEAADADRMRWTLSALLGST